MQRHIFDGIDGRDRGSPGRSGVIGVFQAHDLDVDLRGHLVTSYPFDNATGIVVQSGSTHISIRNGVVRTPGAEGVGIAMAPYSYLEQLRFSLEDQRPTKRITFDVNSRKYHYDDSAPWNYQPPTRYVIDGLKIESGGRGVILAGSDNVLRDSVIEVDSATAVYIYGPNALVEGNTFIVHRKVGGDENTSAPLKMRDADGAVIRNNRFLVKGLFAGTADVAINLLESRGVVIENNLAEGVKELLRKDDASSATARGNVLK